MDDQRISPILPINMQAVRNLQQQAAQIAVQVESEEDVSQYLETSVFNPLLQTQRFRPLHELKTYLSHKLEEIDKPEEEQITHVEAADETASRFENENDELQSRTLLLLRERILEQKSPDDILKETLKIYKDRALADEALEFLSQTTESETKTQVLEAKREFNEQYGMEIRAGRNMGAQARAFSKEGLGAPTSLRQLYKELLTTPRDSLQLFDYLADQFPYAKMRMAIAFILHSLGSDLRSRGPSIPNPELKQLIDEARSLQGVLGVYRFFQSRMAYIIKMFRQYKLAFPPRLGFEMLARVFVKLLGERYMNPERVLLAGKILGISEELMAKIIIFSQMREAIRQISPRYYRNPKHKEEFLKAFNDTLEQLEKEKEDEEEKK